MWAAIDKFITVEKPWALAEKPEDRARLANVLYTAAEGLRIICGARAPGAPEGHAKNLGVSWG